MAWVYIDHCAVLVTQSCLTLCDPVDCSLTGSSVHGDSPGKNTGVDSHTLLQGNLLDPVIEPVSPASPALAGGFFTTVLPGKPRASISLSVKHREM